MPDTHPEVELAHIVVEGIVQGVGFRWFVQDEAQRLGLEGTVRNLPGGGVEVLAEGSRRSVEKLVEVMRRGNGWSRVDRCRIEWKPAEGRYNGFDILIGGRYGY